MPGNLRDGLTKGLSTASKKRRPGSHYLESPFLLSKHAFQTRPELYTRSISSPALDLIAQQRKQAPGQRRGASAQLTESSPGGCREGFYFAGEGASEDFRVSV